MVFVVVVVYCTEHRVSSRYRSRRESVCVRSLCIIVYVCVCVIVDLKTQAISRITRVMWVQYDFDVECSELLSSCNYCVCHTVFAEY